MHQYYRKRKFQNRDNQPCKRPRQQGNFPIISTVQAQQGIRSQLVIFESSFETPYTVLQNALDRINSFLNVQALEQKEGKRNYQLKASNEILAEGCYESQTEAKRGLAELALANLKKSCFTIFRKVHPKDSPKVDINAPSSSSSEKPSTSTSDMPSLAPDVPNLPQSSLTGGIGAKLMAQMGWAGGGLGAQGQGSTDIIQPYIQIQRQGLGSKNIVQEVTKVLQEYASSGDINSIAFSPDFTKEERATIHEVARKLNLKSRSYGKGPDRLLVVQSKVKPWDLVHSLMESGGESSQLKLILPSDFA